MALINPVSHTQSFRRKQPSPLNSIHRDGINIWMYKMKWNFQANRSQNSNQNTNKQQCWYLLHNRHVPAYFNYPAPKRKDSWSSIIKPKLSGVQAYLTYKNVIVAINPNVALLEHLLIKQILSAGVCGYCQRLHKKSKHSEKHFSIFFLPANKLALEAEFSLAKKKSFASSPLLSPKNLQIGLYLLFYTSCKCEEQRPISCASGEREPAHMIWFTGWTISLNTSQRGSHLGLTKCHFAGNSLNYSATALNFGIKKTHHT